MSAGGRVSLGDGDGGGGGAHLALMEQTSGSRKSQTKSGLTNGATAKLSTRVTGPEARRTEASAGAVDWILGSVLARQIPKTADRGLGMTVSFAQRKPRVRTVNVEALLLVLLEQQVVELGRVLSADVSPCRIEEFEGGPRIVRCLAFWSAHSTMDGPRAHRWCRGC